MKIQTAPQVEKLEKEIASLNLREVVAFAAQYVCPAASTVNQSSEARPETARAYTKGFSKAYTKAFSQNWSKATF